MNISTLQINVDATRDINAIRLKVNQMVKPVLDQCERIKDKSVGGTDMIMEIHTLFEGQHKQLLNCHSNLLYWKKKEGVTLLVQEAISHVLDQVEHLDAMITNALEEVKIVIELFQSIDRIEKHIDMHKAATAPYSHTVN